MARGRLHFALGLACIAAATLPLAAAPVASIEAGAMPRDVAVLDIRAEKSCRASAPDGARCLPAATLLAGDGGAPVGFHALRWVLGALGLTGAERLAVYPGTEVARDDALAVAGLLDLAGQREVMVLAGPIETGATGGQPRGMWRQVIYTAPMRTRAMVVAPKPKGSLRDRLRDYAQGGGRVAFAPAP